MKKRKADAILARRRKGYDEGNLSSNPAYKRPGAQK